MEILKTIEDTRNRISRAKSEGLTIGFVPTMGALHAGHVSLMEQAKRETGFVVVSIFVNPTQFGPTEDLDAYPRDLEADAAKCEKAGVDLIFAPTVAEMYPIKNRTWVNLEGELTETLCGGKRPGHFRGVTTVCTKLFNIVLPDVAFFGQKDAQQVAVIKAMVADLNMPLKIRVCPIIREESGLAMSSRNSYLSAQQRQEATILYKSLTKCRELFDGGCRDTKKLKNEIISTLKTYDKAEIDYVEIVDFGTLKNIDKIEKTALAAIAVKIGTTRLIDNILLDIKTSVV